MASVIRLQGALCRKLLPALKQRLISTSPKNSDTASGAVTKFEDPVINSKNWVHYGFNKRDFAADNNALQSTLFASITLCIVFGGFILAYLPDYNLRDWSQREAFLELRRREANGLPLISPNLIDPAKITLPSDEELGDQEIII